jgi:pilus assembly protein CpaF
VGWLNSGTKGKREGGASGEERSALKPAVNPRNEDSRESRLYEVKNRVHLRLLERLDLEHVDQFEDQRVAQAIRQALAALLDEEKTPLNQEERLRLAKELEFEILGLGPLEPFMHDPGISDILVNRYDQVYLERGGKLEKTSVRFRDNAHLMNTINKIVTNVGRRIDESSPMVDARLPDGSRVNAIIPPLALDGPMLSIRRFAVKRLTLEELIAKGTITADIGQVLQAIVKAKLNILISGGTGSGKTTLLNIVSGFIPPQERILTIEDSAELQLQQEHVGRMETRPPNIEGRGEITQRELVRNALRMRPDRIVVGEVRGPEVMDMLQAMNTGHEGSLTTVHANNPRDALLRLETMITLSGIALHELTMRRLISSSLDAIIHLARHTDGVRRLEAVSEITGMEGDVISMQDIFVFDRQGIDEEGKILGNFVATGVRPKFAERCRIFGVPLAEELFTPPPLERRRFGRH